MGSFRAKITYLKSHYKPWALASKQIEIDLSNEVLNIDFNQGAVKILEVKVGAQKKYLPTWLTPGELV